MPISDSLQANTQHAVPQNIMDVEFKLIGELTMRQFFYIMVFAAIAYVAWSFNIPSVLKWPTVIGSALLGIAFAFVPIEDRVLDEWLVNFFAAVYDDNQKIWKKEINPPSAFLHENINIVKQELITLAPTTSRRKLEQYLLDQHDKEAIDPLDIPEEEYREKVHTAFMNAAPVQTAVAVEEPMVAPEIAPDFPDMTPSSEEKEPEGKDKKAQEKAPEEIHPSKETVSKAELIKPRPKAKKDEFKMPAVTTGTVPLAPITPDRHTGRKFTNLITSGGNIVLPIRGEKVLSIPEEVENYEENTAKKAQQLKEYLEHIKATEGIHVPETAVAPVAKEEEKVEKEAEVVLQGIQAENERLMTEIEKLKAELSKTPEEPPKEKRTSLRQLIEKQEKKEQTLHELEERVQTLRPEDTTPGVPADQVQAEQVATPKVANVIAGIVKDPHGKGLAGILMIIKNNHGDPVRAIKSNALGQFSISNPLPNGQYKINVDVNKETSFTFDIIDVEAAGKILSPLEFVGK